MPGTADGDGGSSFVVALPAGTEWAGVLENITLSGPGGSTKMDLETDQPMAILRDPASGQVLGILRDPSPAETPRADAAAAPLPGSDLEIVVSRGIPAVTEWRRDERDCTVPGPVESPERCIRSRGNVGAGFQNSVSRASRGVRAGIGERRKSDMFLVMM